MNIRIFLTLAGLVLVFDFNTLATVRYVDSNSTNATPPFTDWTTAAATIQDAVNSSVSGDLVLVTNGVYTMGTVTNNGQSYRVSVTNAITLQSINGPAVTVIDGGGAVPCVYLTDGTVLSGFTIIRGHNNYRGGGVNCASTLDQSGYPLPGSAQIINCCVNSNLALIDGGGVASGIISNCIISHNKAGGAGGGALLSTLVNCTLSYNIAGGGALATGGGTAFSTLKYCLISSNTNNGAFSSDLNNCLVVSNIGVGSIFCYLTNSTVCGNSQYGVTSVNGGYSLIYNSVIYYNGLGNCDYRYGLTIANSCTTPLAPGSGNITNAPLFVNMAAGDFHLGFNSPCINAGNNSLLIGTRDYDGNTRIVGGTVDIGAYEFQSPSSSLSYAWAQQYGLTTDGSADFANPDGDGLNNWQEWIAGTNPTNAVSVLKMLAPSNSVSGLKVSWQSVSGKTYFLQRASDLTAQPAFSTLQSNLSGQASSTVYTDNSATNGGPYFYRVGVQQ